MIKVLMLDYAGVVGTWDEDLFLENLSKTYSLSKKEVNKTLYDEDLFQEYETGQIDYKSFSDAFSKRSKKKVDPKEYLKAIKNVHRDKPEVISFIKTLKNKIKLVLVPQNGDGEWIVNKRDLRSVKIFDKIYVTYKFKVGKIDSIFFKQCIKDLKVKPEEILYFDDKQKYIDAAKKVGIGAFLFTNLNDFKENLENEIHKRFN